MKISEKKIKMVEYVNKKLYYFNNIDNQKLNEKSDFLLASITKIFTIIALLILHKEKIINVNHKCKKYIDNRELENVKIIDIINHISGLKQDPDNFTNSIENYENLKKEQLLKYSKGTYVYSNLGYMILGVIIEKSTNVTYQKFIINNILKPLKMNNTGFDKTKITHYNLNQLKLSKKEENERYNSVSDGGLKSCIIDLIKFTKFPSLLNKSSLKILEKLYICYTDKNYFISHYGNTTGIHSFISIEYNKEWDFKNITIELKTVV